MSESTYAETADLERRKELLDFLFTFVEDGDKELNPVLAGYFCKMANTLLTKRAKQTIQYMYGRPQVLLNLCRHLESRGIYELLLRVLRFDNSLIEDIEVSVSVQKARTIDCLVDMLGPHAARWENANAASILTELAENSALWSHFAQDPEIFKKALANVLTATGSTSSLQASLTVLTAIVSASARVLTRNAQGAALSEQDLESAMNLKSALASIELVAGYD